MTNELFVRLSRISHAFPQYLDLVSDEKFDGAAMPCVALCHNERNILKDFLEHYRSLAKIAFLIVDDRSTDGSREFLLQQPDVTLFQPIPGSTYREHKRYWRQALLDSYSDGKWCLAPDIDEHFVYLGMENKPLPDLIAEIEREGADAMCAFMLDMYADKPLADHVYSGEGGLRSAFPFFDGPESYLVMTLPAWFHRKFPVPSTIISGGVRERLIFSPRWFESIFRKLLTRISGLPFREAKNRLHLFKCECVRRAVFLLNGRPSMQPLLLTKLPLLRWRRGYFFNGGAHVLNKSVPLYSQSAALLHYWSTRGMDGIEYLVMRGQHAFDAGFYRRTRDVILACDQTPVCAISRKFVDSNSLVDLLQ